jgi:hypothetical protein
VRWLDGCAPNIHVNLLLLVRIDGRIDVAVMKFETVPSLDLSAQLIGPDFTSHRRPRTPMAVVGRFSIIHEVT